MIPLPHSSKILKIVESAKKIYTEHQRVVIKQNRRKNKENREAVDASFNFLKGIISAEETNYLEEIEKAQKKLVSFHHENLWNNIALFDSECGSPNKRTTNRIKPKFTKSIDELFTGANQQTTKVPQEMGEIFDNFYRNLYSLKEIDENAMEDIITRAKIENSSQSLSHLNNQFSKKKISETIKRQSSSSSPGIDGIGMSFYKKYNKFLSPFIASYANRCVDRGWFDEETTRGLIKPIPKKDSDSRDLKNVRPITLLNCLYKIITGTIAFELGDVLPN
jgi:hypothetical protein